MRAGVLTFVRTVRHLRLVQIASRLSMGIRRHLVLRSSLLQNRCRPEVRAYDSLSPLPFPLTTAEPAGEIDSGRVFTFLGQRVDLGQPIDWEPTGVDRLWQYQLHSFGFAHALGCRFRAAEGDEDYRLFRRLVEEWLASCPIASSPAWDPYPVSLRVRNWLRAHELFDEALREDVGFRDRLLDSLYTQAAYLERFVEHHLLGNHLIENGRALLLAGLLFGDRKARRWRRKGERILWRELGRQFVPDGGHEERSPMYHQLMLGLYREVVGTMENMGERVPDGVPARLDSMTAWLATMHHPDGRISLFNDATFGMAGSAAELLEACPEQEDGLTALPESGYFVFRDRTAGNCLLFDCGPLGPDHQPGHGHCDCLSFELSVEGKRMIVDSGVGTYYGDLEYRHYYRSTRAHNTVQLDGEEQSEIWDRFRVARRAAPRGVCWGRSGDVEWVSGEHTGYQRLPGKVVHRRWVIWIDKSYWLICDRLTGRGSHVAESFLHFHPEAVVTESRQNGDLFEGGVQRKGAVLQVLLWGADEVDRLRGKTEDLQGWYAPDFNRHTANAVWRIRRAAELPLWLAYLLVPAGREPSVRFEADGERQVRADLSFSSVSYRVACSEESVEVLRL